MGIRSEQPCGVEKKRNENVAISFLCETHRGYPTDRLDRVGRIVDVPTFQPRSQPRSQRTLLRSC